MMKLAIFPLGNPGDKYKRTRHNAARIVCLSIREACGLANADIIIPDTYMNESGSFVKNFIKNNKKNNSEIDFDKNKNVNNILPIVMYDDKDLPWGDVKLSFGNSSGGHNGVQSVMDAIGKDFYRIRIGIGDPDIMPIYGEGVVQNYVMSNITDREMKVLKSQTLQDKVVEALSKIIKETA